tara:strand:+ start:325 stop:501 length:177 start_codon:yes stop_codon:yes gene_type:complete
MVVVRLDAGGDMAADPLAKRMNFDRRKGLSESNCERIGESPKNRLERYTVVSEISSDD